MEELLLLLIYVTVELVFWGVFYGTGYVLTPIVSFGYLKPEQYEKDKELRKQKKSLLIPLIKKTENITYLKSENVALVGMLFWAFLAVGFVMYMSS